MSDQKQDDNKHDNRNGAGVAQSPVHQPFYRQTLGLSQLKTKPPELIEREKKLSEAHEGALSLEELRKRVAAREIQKETEDAESKKRRQLNYLLKLGEKIHKAACPENPLSSEEDLGNLLITIGKLSSAGLEAIWKSIWALQIYDKTLLSIQFQFDLPGERQTYVNFSSRNLARALAKLKYNLQALVAYREGFSKNNGNDPSEKAGRDNRIDFLLIGKPYTTCFTLVSQSDNLASSAMYFPMIREIPSVPVIYRTFNLDKEGEITMASERKHKLKGITALLQNQALVYKLRDLKIHETEQLMQFTSIQLIKKFSIAGGKYYLSVRAIAKKLDKYGLHLADGKEATRSLFNYHPQTYKPPAEIPATAPQLPAPPGESGVSSSATELITAKTSPEAPAGQKSLRATLKRFSSAFDFLTTNGGSPQKIECFEENFTDENGHEYILTIGITKKGDIT